MADGDGIVLPDETKRADISCRLIQGNKTGTDPVIGNAMCDKTGRDEDRTDGGNRQDWKRPMISHACQVQKRQACKPEVAAGLV